MPFVKGQPRLPNAGRKPGAAKRKAAEARALLNVLDKTLLNPWERLVELIQNRELRPVDEAKILMHMTEYIDQKAKPTDTPSVQVNVANVQSPVAQSIQAQTTRETVRAVLEDPAAAEAVKLLSAKLSTDSAQPEGLKFDSPIPDSTPQGSSANPMPEPQSGVQLIEPIEAEIIKES